MIGWKNLDAAMSGVGTYRKSQFSLKMSAFGGEAEVI